MSWPFQEKALAKGLRELLGVSRLTLQSVTPLPRPTPFPGNHGENLGQYRLQLLTVDLEIEGQPRQLALVLKEFSRHKAGEHYFYRFLAPHLPVYTPLLIAGEDKDGWLVTLAPGQLRNSEKWDADDYRAAVDNLAMLHDRYWGLQEDLENFDNLKQPLGSDYEKLFKKHSRNSQPDCFPGTGCATLSDSVSVSAG